MRKRAGYGVPWAVLLLTLLLSAACGGGGFTPPSHDEVVRDVEHYYAHNGNDPRRPSGEPASCPTRSAVRWFDCEFDYPTIAAPTKITCVHVWVAGANSWERDWDRWVVTDIAKERAQAKRLGRDSVSSSY